MTSAFGLWSLCSSASHRPASAYAASTSGAAAATPCSDADAGLHLLAHRAQVVDDPGEAGEVLTQREGEGQLLLEVGP